MQLSKYVNVKQLAVTASTTDKLELEIDTANFEGVMFMGFSHTTTGGIATDLTLKHAATTTGTFVSLGSSNVASSTAKGAFFSDLFRPKKRFVEAELQTTSANSHLWLAAILYGPRKQPTTWAASSTATVPGYLKSMVSATST